jgi:phosphatidylglycerol lysyltransferase
LPFQLGEDKLLYCPPGADGCVVYGLIGRTAVVVGDPIASADSRDAVLGAFLERSHRLDRVVTFYQATTVVRPALVQRGYRLFRVGQEAIIDLETFSLAGSRRANLRHTITRAGRGGLTVRFYRHGISGDNAQLVLDELAKIDEAWRRHTGPRLGFTIGEFDRNELSELPIAVAFEAQNQPVAFTSFRPTGSDGGWVLDLMRRTPDGVPGAVEWCIAEAALAFRSGGSGELSLGLAPLAGLTVLEGSVPERVMALASRLVRPWYDVSSLAFFKAKFDPRWEPRYGAVASRPDAITFAVSLLRLHTRRSRLSAAGPVALDPSVTEPAAARPTS